MVRGASENLVEIDSAKDLAIEHLFERSSVARELHAAGMLLRRGIGRVSVEAARIFVQTDSRFIRPDPNGSLLTTREFPWKRLSFRLNLSAGPLKWQSETSDVQTLEKPYYCAGVRPPIESET
jgi:hypothetical protein